MKRILFYIVQLTWCLPVNIISVIPFLICKAKGYRQERFGNAFITYVPWNQGGISLGLFIFMKEGHESKDWTYNTRIHEYGHCWQCLLLGPLYYIVVGLPSFIWCGLPFFVNYRKKNNISYYKLYCESWANAWGQKFSGLKMKPEKR